MSEPYVGCGHGHVYPNPDGIVARCGGPGFCEECKADLAQSLLPKVEGVHYYRKGVFLERKVTFAVANSSIDLSPEEALRIATEFYESVRAEVEEANKAPE